MGADKLKIHVTDEDANYLRFEFSSNGKTIEKKQFPHFFEPFFIFDKEHKKNTNLDLALVNEIVNIHHGRVWVDYSQEDSNGLTIVTLLPKRRTI